MQPHSEPVDQVAEEITTEPLTADREIILQHLRRKAQTAAMVLTRPATTTTAVAVEVALLLLELPPQMDPAVQVDPVLLIHTLEARLLTPAAEAVQSVTVAQITEPADQVAEVAAVLTVQEWQQAR
jgi:hypothetical protein